MTHDSTAPPLPRILREAIKRRHTRTVKPNVLRGTEKTNVTNIVRETHQKRTGCSRLPLPLSAMEHALAETVLKKITNGMGNASMLHAACQKHTRATRPWSSQQPDGCRQHVAPTASLHRAIEYHTVRPCQDRQTSLLQNITTRLANLLTRHGASCLFARCVHCTIKPMKISVCDDKHSSVSNRSLDHVRKGNPNIDRWI